LCSITFFPEERREERGGEERREEALFIFTIISRPVLLRMLNISSKLLEKIKTHILCSITFSPSRGERRGEERRGEERGSPIYIYDNISLSSS
jgi:hypothetical protein